MKPLEGIRVLEFSTMITASFAAMMLAEQGADVIKVEPIEIGDPMRHLGTQKGGQSALFSNCNRGKRSLRVDLKSDAGRQAVEDLARDTDVVLTNYRLGVMDRFGLGSDHLRSLNPRMIYVGITGFGTEGPRKDSPAYDPIIQAQTGFTAVQGQGKHGPEFMRSLMCDKITAYTACQTVLTALYDRERTGEGRHVDLSMVDSALYFLFPDGFMHHTLLDDDVDHHPPLSEILYDISETSDGGVTISGATPAQQVGLLTAIERLDLFADPRFDSIDKIIENIDAFRDELRAGISRFSTDDLLGRLDENDVPAARPLDYSEVLAHPQFEANDTHDVVEHPQMGSMVRVKPPARFGGARTVPAGHSPAHGQHTREILEQLGRTDDEVAAILDAGSAATADS